VIEIIKMIPGDNGVAYVEILGQSTDTKPTTVNGSNLSPGSQFEELDTGLYHCYSPGNIEPVSSSNWWPE